MPKNRFILSCLILSFFAAGQTLPEGLLSKDYDWFATRLDSDTLDEATAWRYASVYLAKSKKERNREEEVNAYKSLMHLAAGTQRLAYADSMVAAAIRTRSKHTLGASYLSRGVVYYDRKQHSEALENYLLADSLISSAGDDYLEHKVKFNIAQIKYYLGYYDEAQSLFAKCVEYYSDEDAVPYLSSLHSLALCYNRLGKYPECAAANKKGIAEAGRLGHPETVFRFVHSEGINNYFLKEYRLAIGQLKESMPEIIKAGDFANEAVANFYIGKCYWALGTPNAAVSYFIKVDEAFTEKGYMRPDLRETYELLINYYRTVGDVSKQLFYIDRLLSADRFLTANFKYLITRIHKEYDTKALLAERDEIKEIPGGPQTFYAAIGILVTVLTIVLVLYVRTRKLNRRRFEILMQHRAKPIVKHIPVGELGISTDIVESILQRLEKFEQTKKFLEADLTLAKMASLLNSNTKYVSKVIVHYKNKKFIDYINGLRIEYMVRELNENNRLRNYTHKALAEEAGFNTPQNFSKAFAANVGLSLAYFLEELRREDNNGV